MNDLATKLAGLLLAMALPATTLAQDELLNEEQPPIKRYTVELIVFAYAEDVSVGTEIFPPDVIDPPIDDLDAIPEVEVATRQRRHPDYIGHTPVTAG